MLQVLKVSKMEEWGFQVCWLAPRRSPRSPDVQYGAAWHGVCPAVSVSYCPPPPPFLVRISSIPFGMEMFTLSMC